MYEKTRHPASAEVRFFGRNERVGQNSGVVPAGSSVVRVKTSVVPGNPVVAIEISIVVLGISVATTGATEAVLGRDLVSSSFISYGFVLLGCDVG